MLLWPKKHGAYGQVALPFVTNSRLRVSSAGLLQRGACPAILSRDSSGWEIFGVIPEKSAHSGESGLPGAHSCSFQPCMTPALGLHQSSERTTLQEHGICVRDIMTTPVFTIRNDKRMLAVEEIMGWAHVRHVPVIDAAGGLVGIISHRDVLAAAVSTLAVKISMAERRQHMAALDVAHQSHHPVITVRPDMPVQAAASLMRTHHVGCLPVVEEGKLVGIVTATDLLALFEMVSDTAFSAATPASRRSTAGQLVANGLV
jgi:CBS domain-containing membrane protein